MVTYYTADQSPEKPLNMREEFRQGAFKVAGYIHVVRLRDRVIPHEAHDWLAEQKPDYRWCHNPHQVFFFRHKADAMRFKLVWG